jgi:hypothetical protein
MENVPGKRSNNCIDKGVLTVPSGEDPGWLGPSGRNRK